MSVINHEKHPTPELPKEREALAQALKDHAEAIEEATLRIHREALGVFLLDHELDNKELDHARKVCHIMARTCLYAEWRQRELRRMVQVVLYTPHVGDVYDSATELVDMTRWSPEVQKRCDDWVAERLPTIEARINAAFALPTSPTRQSIMIKI